MRSVLKAFVLAGLLVPAAATAAAAQTSLIAGGGYPTVFDDETFLGRGVLVSGGVARSLTRHLSVEGELSVARHRRNEGYLAAEGTPLVAAGRLVHAFGGAGSGARPFASVGVALVRSTGTLTTPSVVAGPDGRPTAGPPASRHWTLTKSGLELGGGVLIRAGERLAFRPEFRWLATGSATVPGAGIQPPIWIARPSMSVMWRIG